MRISSATESRDAGSGNGATSRVAAAGYRADVDGLRAVAVTAVLIYHCDESLLPGGFTGVDVFFVISGYVVAGSLLRRAMPSATVAVTPGAGVVVDEPWPEKPPPEQPLPEKMLPANTGPPRPTRWLLDFYSRRWQRIQPSLVLMVAVAGTLVAMVVPFTEEHADVQQASGMIALVGGANIFFAAGGGTSGAVAADYFARTTAQSGRPLEWNVFMHCWSLGVEEQFYLLFPMLLLARSPLTLISVGVGLSAVLCVVLTVYEAHHAFYLMPSRFWQLGSGVIAYFLLDLEQRGSTDAARVHRWHAQLQRRPELRAALEIASAVLLSLSFALSEGERYFPAPWSLLAVCGTLAYIAAGCGPPARYELRPSSGEELSLPAPLLNCALASRPVVYVGKLSYPIYLWHWPALVALRWLDVWRPAYIAAAVALSLCLAMASFHLVETPFRRWRHRKNGHVLLALLLVLLWLGLLRGGLGHTLCIRPSCVAERERMRLTTAMTVTSGPSAPGVPALEDAYTYGDNPTPPSTPPQLPSPSTPPAPPSSPPVPPSSPAPPYSPPSPSTPPLPPSPPPPSPPPSPPPPYLSGETSCNGGAASGSCPLKPLAALPDYADALSHCCTCRAPSTNRAMYHWPLTSLTGLASASRPPCRPHVPTSHYPNAAFTNQGADACWAQAKTGGRLQLESCLSSLFCAAGGSSNAAQLPIIFLIGDSHVWNFVDALRLASAGKALVVHVAGNCGFASDEINHHAAAQHPTRFGNLGPGTTLAQVCTEVRAEVLSVLSAVLRTGDVVATSIAALKFEGASADDIGTYTSLMSTTHAVASAAGASLLLLGDLPDLRIQPLTGTPPAGCRALDLSASHGAYYCQRERAEAYQRYYNYTNAFRSLSDDSPGIFYFDPFHLFFGSNGLAEGTVPGTQQIIMRDNDHTAATVSSLYLWPYMCTFLSNSRLLGAPLGIATEARAWPRVAGCWRDCA